MIKDGTSWQAILLVAKALQPVTTDYTLLNAAAIVAQGVDVQVDTLDFSVQWDVFEAVHATLQPTSRIEHSTGMDRFSFEHNGLMVTILCYYNTVVVTDPDRICIEHNGQFLWVKALDYYVRTLPFQDLWVQAIKSYWHLLQAKNSQLHEKAWNQDAYDAWVLRHGDPYEASQRILKDPQARLGSLYRHMGDLSGKKVINLLGSHGSKAIAMALLGADSTVVDLSQENAHYAREVAQASGVALQYLVADVLAMPEAALDASYDLVLMELGILHYFIDLAPLAQVIIQLLRGGGRLLLQDFHPISTKLITSKGKKQRVDGNYFEKSIVVTDVAFSKHLSAARQVEVPKVYLRKWTLGEIVTAMAVAGLHIVLLEEEPNMKIDDIGIPKTFTLVAEKLPL